MLGKGGRGWVSGLQAPCRALAGGQWEGPLSLTILGLAYKYIYNV